MIANLFPKTWNDPTVDMHVLVVGFRQLQGTITSYEKGLYLPKKNSPDSKEYQKNEDE